MSKVYQPFILEKADQLLEVLKDDIQCTPVTKNRLCDILTAKFIEGELNPDDPINSIFDEDELMSFIHECLVQEDLDILVEKGLVGILEDENNENMYFVTEEGKKYMEKNLLKKK